MGQFKTLKTKSTASKESVPLTLYEHKGLENRIREESCQSTGG